MVWSLSDLLSPLYISLPEPVVVTLGELLDLGVVIPAPGDMSPVMGRGERLDSGDMGAPGGSDMVEVKLSRLG